MSSRRQTIATFKDGARKLVEKWPLELRSLIPAALREVALEVERHLIADAENENAR